MQVHARSRFDREPAHKFGIGPMTMSTLLWIALTVPGLLMWLAVCLLPWRPWSTRPHLEASAGDASDPLDDVTVLIPARDEAELIAATLRAAMSQGAGLHAIVIDDDSSDGTADEARSVGDPRVRVISVPPSPPGWSGKLWALEQGLALVETPLTLLLDADIALAPGILAQLHRHRRQQELTLASLFVELRMRSIWERLMVPAFGYFFRLLYPFRRSNAPGSRVAAAAGGCVLVKTQALRQLGGFAAFRDALIDDCTLAQRIKAGGGRTWIGLTRAAHSRRPYPSLASIWDLVTRCAYTELRYSPLRLAACTVLMLLAFCAPVAGLFAPLPAARLIAAGALVAMMASYLPTLRYYRRNPLWALALPAIGALYLAMTWTSAIRYWRGTRSRWRGRAYSAN